MAWAVKITVEAHELHRPLGVKDDIALRGYVFSPPLCRAESIFGAWAKLEAEVHDNLLAKLEPAVKEDA